MKYRTIIVSLIAVSIIALMFVSTAAALVSQAYMTGIKSGKDFTFTIDTTFDQVNPFLGTDVDPTSIVLTVFDNKGNPIIIEVDQSAVELFAGSIVLNMVKQDGFPSHASAIQAVGGIAGGDTFLATGPGWAWGRLSR